MRSIRRHQSVESDLKKLKKYRSVPDEVRHFESLLHAEFQFPGEHVRYPGLKCSSRDFPPTVRKAMIPCKELGGGAKSGLRYIYEELELGDQEMVIVCLTVYVHQNDVSEGNVIQIIRERIADYDHSNYDGLLDEGFKSDQSYR